MERKEIVGLFEAYGFIVSEDLVNSILDFGLSHEELDRMLELISSKISNLFFINKDIFSILFPNFSVERSNLSRLKGDVNWVEFEKVAALKEMNDNSKPYDVFLNYLEKQINNEAIEKVNEYLRNDSSDENRAGFNHVKDDEPKTVDSSQSDDSSKMDEMTGKKIVKDVDMDAEAAGLSKNVNNDVAVTPKKEVEEAANIASSPKNINSDDSNVDSKIAQTSNDESSEILVSEISDDSDSFHTSYEEFVLGNDVVKNPDNSSLSAPANQQKENTRAQQSSDLNSSSSTKETAYSTKGFNSSRNQNSLVLFSQEDDLSDFPNDFEDQPLNYDAYLNSKMDSFKDIEIRFSYNQKQKAVQVSDFTNYFRSRFNKISRILRQRTELMSALPIRRLKQIDRRQDVSVIGMVYDIVKFDSSIQLTIEDLNDSLKMYIRKDSDLYSQVSELIYDEVIGIKGNVVNHRFYPKQIFWPDVSLTKQVSYFDSEAVSVFISDLHVGSKQFLAKEFEMFINWLKGRYPGKLGELAKKVKYVFMVGDVVDGVGIYPGQKDDLALPDIYNQYDMFSKYVLEIPEHIKVFVMPGNHDAVRLAEPQPTLPYVLTKKLWDKDNVIMLSNPAIVRTKEGDKFNDFLLYHGYSFDYYVANVEIIRESGGYDRGDMIMSYLLKRRHLAPAYGSTLYFPDNADDSLVISDIPDVFVSGHIHKTAIGSYNNVFLVQSSCWQSRTAFQEKVGHHPEPGRVPIFNPKTRKIEVLNFYKGKE